MTTFQLDTSGAIDMRDMSLDGPRPRKFPYRQVAVQWSELPPFVQGYVGAVIEAATTTTMWPLRFRSLSPEALAKIVSNCERALQLQHLNLGAAYNANDAGGRCFWSDQQAGLLADFPPCAVSAANDGVIRFEPA